ncbi:MAG: glycosyltransferase, partial [Saprospiraceae bacterium]|nr:glycosyltransferase [Saprospiraceae bacterium]
EYEFVDLRKMHSFTQPIDADLFPCDRIALMCVIKESIEAELRIEVEDPESGEVVARAVRQLTVHGSDQMGLQTVNFEVENLDSTSASQLQCTISLQGEVPFELVVQEPEDGLKLASMRLFRQSPGYSRSMLDKCVKSIRACGIADDAIHIIEKKQSASANRNEGYAQTTRPYVCYADDDVEITNPHALRELLHAMYATDAAVVGPRLVTDIDTIFCADPYFNEKMHPKPRGLGEPVSGKYRYIREVPWLPSTLIIARTEAIRAVGGFDEGYIGSQMEDVDFCLKIRQRDLKCVYVGTVDVVHYNHQRNDNFALNFELFAGRWGEYPELFTSIGDDASYLNKEQM